MDGRVFDPHDQKKGGVKLKQFQKLERRIIPEDTPYGISRRELFCMISRLTSFLRYPHNVVTHHLAAWKTDEDTWAVTQLGFLQGKGAEMNVDGMSAISIALCYDADAILSDPRFQAFKWWVRPHTAFMQELLDSAAQALTTIRIILAERGRGKGKRPVASNLPEEKRENYEVIRQVLHDFIKLGLNAKQEIVAPSHEAVKAVLSDGRFAKMPGYLSGARLDQADHFELWISATKLEDKLYKMR